MNTLTVVTLLGWFIYSWKIAFVLFLMSFVIALFYSGADEGGADSKVFRTFSIIVLALSLVMIGIATSQVEDGESERPKMCSHMHC